MRKSRVKPGMTLSGLVRAYWPSATDDDCEFVVWNLTPYPAGTVAQIESAIVKVVGWGILPRRWRINRAMQKQEDEMLAFSRDHR